MITEQTKQSVSYSKLSIILGFLFIVNLFISHRIFVTNLELTKDSIEITKLEETNKEFVIQLSKKESVENMIKQAKRLGFDDTNSIIYLDTTSLAQK